MKKLLALVFCSVVFAACSNRQEPAPEAAKSEVAKADARSQYPAPRYPSYLKTPATLEEVMPYARQAVRQRGGRTPLGQVEPGKRVAMFAGNRGLVDPNPLILQALVEAY